VQIHKNDNVEVGDNGHKDALCDIKKGENIITYGSPIGHATENIKKGDHVHTHNVKTNLSGNLEYAYNYKDYGIKPVKSDLYFEGYVRENGDVGIRNEIWIIPTVGCVNKVAKTLAERTGAYQFEHPFGCSQLGGDLLTTQRFLCGLIRHPNAGGVLVLGLGCEENGIQQMKTVLGEYDPARVRFLNLQDCADEMADGMAIEPVDGKSSPHQSDLSTVLRNHLNGKIRCLPDALE
jgi:altronate hydrolase